MIKRISKHRLKCNRFFSQGKEFNTVCDPALTDFSDIIKLKACTTVECKTCDAGMFRGADAAPADPCKDCPVNHFPNGNGF